MAYKFTATQNGITVQPKAKLKVHFAMPKASSANTEVMYMEPEGKLTELSAMVKNIEGTSFLVTDLERFSTYLLVDLFPEKRKILKIIKTRDQIPGFLLQFQNVFCGFVGDLLELFIRELQLQEALHLYHRIPHGEVTAVDKSLRAIAVNVAFAHTLRHKHQGAGHIEETIRIVEDIVSLFIKLISAKMGGDHLQIGEHLDHPAQALGVGVVKPMVAHMEDHRKLALYLFIHGEEPLVVNGKHLRIRVHFNASQALFHNEIHFVSDIFHCGVDRAKAKETRLVCHLFQNEFVDMPGAVRAHSHGQNYKPGGAGHIAPLQQGLGGTVHSFVAKAVKHPNAVSGLGGNGVGVNMGMKINKI